MSTSITSRAAIVLAEIDAALALAEKATPGPWEIGNENNQCCDVSLPKDLTISLDRQGRFASAFVIERSEMLGNAHFIAASRTLLPASLQIIRDDIKAWLELRDSLQVGRDDVTTWDFCNRRLTTLCDQWEATK